MSELFPECGGNWEDLYINGPLPALRLSALIQPSYWPSFQMVPDLHAQNMLHNARDNDTIQYLTLSEVGNETEGFLRCCLRPHRRLR